ncbi:hypothetical protein MML48_7g00012221 [Holotrichia oblita]|uniref:Uncharacterized protein n=1 Tax=Holotrichia oblita TaxID=644536 RepID=A0ACB9SSY6_HOLOL|nr:hypothetical protein MML48_7g00012221 [Holotrichia oblita]
MHSWLESESSKGSNEIASALYDTLNKIEISEVINEVKLIADGCSGQNKNSTILAMAAKWLSQAPLQGGPHFNSDVNNPKPICKQGKNLSLLNRQNIVSQFVKLKPKKVKNVDELLIKHYGQEWMEQYVQLNLQFYKTILRQQQYARGTEDEGEDEDLPEELLCSPGHFVEDNSI